MTGKATSTAFAATRMASRYLRQLFKHWAHNLEVQFDEAHGTVVFPKDAQGANWPGDAILTMTAGPDGLECGIEASDPDQMEGLKKAVALHLDHFAFREAPLRFDWR